MSNILSYKLYNKVKRYTSGWVSNNTSEGIQFTGGPDPSIDIDWNNDTSNDIVKIADGEFLKPSKAHLIQMFAGYRLQDNVPDVLDTSGEKQITAKRGFSNFMKEWDSIENDDLGDLIDYTYPSELRDLNVKVIYVMGSSSPLAANIANLIKEIFYPDAKIVDVLKAYYGSDIDNTVDKRQRSLADEKTQNMVDSYAYQQRPHFSGHIKKSGVDVKTKKDWNEIDDEIESDIVRYTDDESGYDTTKVGGIQSGARRLLKPGHTIDDGILAPMRDAMEEWKNNRSSISSTTSLSLLSPMFLTVDDVVIGGSTFSSLSKILLNAIKEDPDLSKSLDDDMMSRVKGYILLAYGKDGKFEPKLTK